jgi:hypothetical protein
VLRFCWIEGGGYGQETVHSGADYLDVLWELELSPGLSSVHEYVWDLTGNDQKSLPSGAYRAKIDITSSPRDGDLSAEIRLTI